MDYDESLLGTMPDTILAKKTNKDCGFIWRERTKRNIPSFKSVYGLLPRIDYNIHAFDNINQKSAYWLGYYYADGCICPTTKGRKTVTLGSCDYDSILKLCDFYTIDPKYIQTKSLLKGKKAYVLGLCNKHLFDRLVSLGCIPQKSHTVKPPIIDKKFYNNFLLGLFDGDGSISVNTRINQWKVSYGTGSPYLFDWLKSILDEKRLIYTTECRTNGNLPFYTLTLIGLAGKVFLSGLYDEFNIEYCMKRKYEKYLLLKEAKFGSPRLQEWEKEIIKSSSNLEESIEIISKDPRNYGWIRSIYTLRDFKRKESLGNFKTAL